MTAPHVDQAELAAMRLILSNVVARLALLEANDPEERRGLLNSMSHACQLAAQRSAIAPAGVNRDDLVARMLRHIDEFFKGITIG
jgi:hypothetical protein